MVSDANGCESQQLTTIQAGQSVAVTAPSDKEIVRGQTVSLASDITSSTTDYTIQWTPSTFLSCDDCANPTFTGTQEQTYQVIVTTSQMVVLMKMK